MALEGKSNRDLFTSKIGVIAATAGSAVGLGNIWKFPYEAGQNGGGAFLLIYSFFILAIGLPIMISEFVIGRKARANPVGSFKKLAPNSNWHFIGLMGVVAAFMILAFYGSVAGWTLEYIFKALQNSFVNKSSEELSVEFNTFISNPVRPVLWQLVFMALTAWIVLAGIKDGIEKYTKVLMPLLLVIIVGMCIRTISLGQNIDADGNVIGDSMNGLKFLFSPDISKITTKTVLSALGQAFFSLSLGMGTIITYGSYVRKTTRLTRTALQVTILDSLIAVLSGVAIFPAVFYFNVEPSSGPGLVFTVLPSIFQEMTGGYIWTILFFFLLAVAALTSSISLLEVAVAYFTEQLKMNRKKATWLTTVIIAILGVFCTLSTSTLSDFTIFGFNIFDLMEHISSNILLPLGGLLIAVFVGWVFQNNEFYEELSNSGTLKLKLYRLFRFIIKFIAPIAIALIFLTSIGLIKF